MSNTELAEFSVSKRHDFEMQIHVLHMEFGLRLAKEYLGDQVRPDFSQFLGAMPAFGARGPVDHRKWKCLEDLEVP